MLLSASASMMMWALSFGTSGQGFGPLPRRGTDYFYEVATVFSKVWTSVFEHRESVGLAANYRTHAS